MRLTAIERGARALWLTWNDGTAVLVPYIWLRDNDTTDLHPHTRERTLDLTTVPLSIQPELLEFDAGALNVRWPGKTDFSVYTSDWLYEHRPGRARPDPARVARQLWNNTALPDIPRADARACVRSRPELREALLTAKRCGLLIFDGLADDPQAGVAFAEEIGFKRQTNFGTLFDVLSKPEPNNLAYTSLRLPLHTDLPNQELVPGYQFLHAFRNSVLGGESVFADGFAVCADLQREEPAAYKLLSAVPIPWRFHDETADIRSHRPVIGCAADGSLEQLVFNAHIADIPDLAGEQLLDYYTAYRGLMLRLREPGYALRHTLQPGEMVVFDNRRVLHGREAFDPASGERHLRGFYIDYNEVDSRIRVLSGEGAGSDNNKSKS